MALMSMINNPLAQQYPPWYKPAPWEMQTYPGTPPIMPPQQMPDAVPAPSAAVTPAPAQPAAQPGQPQAFNYGSSTAQRLATADEAQQYAQAGGQQPGGGLLGGASDKAGLIKQIMALYGGM